jgi:hypothetical protein
MRGRKVFLRERDGMKRELPARGWEHFKLARMGAGL